MGARRVVLETLKDQIDGLRLRNYRVTAVNRLFVPDENRKNLPMFSIATEPENISVKLGGQRADRSLRVIIQGFLGAKMLAATDIDEASLLDGEDLVDAIIDKLTSAEAVAAFEASLPIGCGFSIIEIGPIIVEQFALVEDLVYMSIPCLVQFLL